MTEADTLFGPDATSASVDIPLFRTPELGGSSEAHDGLPWRSRACLPQDCSQFKGRDRFALYVVPSAVQVLRAETADRAPDEAFGFLMGRQFQDQMGLYTVVFGVAYADRLSAGPGHVHLSPAESAELRRRAEASFPAADIVGWTHSHPRPSAYSGTDRSEQRTWAHDADVGILTFMRGSPWARAYAGPSGRPVYLTDEERPPAPDERQEEAGRARPVLSLGREREPMHGTDLGVDSRVQPSTRGVAALLQRRETLPLLLAAAVTVTAAASLAGSQPQPVARQNASDPARAVTRDWSCTPVVGLPPLHVRCVGPVGTGVTGWSWDLAGIEDTARTTERVFSVPGRYTIRLTLVTPSGSVDAGDRVVTATRS